MDYLVLGNVKSTMQISGEENCPHNFCFGWCRPYCESYFCELRYCDSTSRAVPYQFGK